MDATALMTALNTAKAAELALLEKLGQAIASGAEDQVMTLQRELREAEARTAELETAVNAIDAATAAAVRARIEKERRAAVEARAAQLREARVDHAGLVKAARKIDKALAALDAAMAEMTDAATAYVEKYRTLGMHGPNRAWLSARTWNTELVHHLKERSHPSLRNHLRGTGLQSFGAGKPVADMVPGFDRLMVLLPGDTPEPEKEPA